MSDNRPRILYTRMGNPDRDGHRRLHVGVEISGPNNAAPPPAAVRGTAGPKRTPGISPPLPSLADDSENTFGPVGWLLFFCFVVGTAWGVAAVMTRLCESLPGVLLKSL